ncbi:MAG: TolC family protein [Alloprevotella sp.]|nr:TolC family protein [Alloprevotella sp.]
MKVYRKRTFRTLALLLCLLPTGGSLHGQTLEECWAAAEQNYPLIRQYDLAARTAEATVANIAKGWLPQVSATAQATLQSDVTAWPEEMQTMLSGMGVNVKGLRRDQYRVGLDINQTLYDGGSIRSQQDVARRQADVEAAQTDLGLYGLRERVNEMYFGLLLLDEQLQLGRDRVQVLQANEEKLERMFRKGVVAESDWKAVRAERLGASQQLADLEAQRAALRRLLSLFCGMEVNTPQLPSPSEQQGSVPAAHPQLRLFNARLALADAQERSLDAALMPRLSLFASGYYGYPGYNMFEDMMHHRWTLNGMVGLRLSWNISGLYTRKADKARLRLQREQAETARNVFLFGQRIESTQQDEDAQRYASLMQTDEEIIGLRRDVRRAAESKLEHGIIDAAELIREINAENSARRNQAIHSIERWKAIYDKKVTAPSGR